MAAVVIRARYIAMSIDTTTTTTTTTLPDSTALAARFAALKAAGQSTNFRSNLASEPTHCNVLFEVYTKATHECYIDNMEGFKLLVNWLCPTAEQLHYTHYINMPNVPRLVNGYDATQVSKILASKLCVRYSEAYNNACVQFARSIYVWGARQVTPEYLY